MIKYDISVICTFHDEEYLVGATLGSLMDAVSEAIDRDISRRSGDCKK